MKFSLITYVTAGAVLAQVGASPIGVMISEISTSDFVRLGHPAAPANLGPASAHPIPPPTFIELEIQQLQVDGPVRTDGHKPCGKLRQKAVDASNRLRQALGMPLIEFHATMHEDPKAIGGIPAPKDGFVRILPVGPLPPPSVSMNGAAHRHNHHHHAHGAGHMKQDSFVRRLTFALMALGPWEGRAVAFVLGCGIGVLVRMFWVLAVIGYRSLFNKKQEEEIEYHHILFTEPLDAEEILVPPPTYGYVYGDEKAPLMAADALAEQSEEERK